MDTLFPLVFFQQFLFNFKKNKKNLEKKIIPKEHLIFQPIKMTSNKEDGITYRTEDPEEIFEKLEVLGEG
jgi:hypothetical protein